MTRSDESYARWSARAGFTNGPHDSAFEGVIDGIDVSIDDGRRASGRYLVQLRLQVEVPPTEPPGNIRGTDVERSPLREALRSLVASEPRLHGIRLEPTSISLRLMPTTLPEEAAEIARQAIGLWRSRPAEPYR